MTFAHPSLLSLLVIPVILAFWEWTRAGQTLVMPFDHGRQRRGRLLKMVVLSANTLPAALLLLPELESDLSDLSHYCFGGGCCGRQSRHAMAAKRIAMIMRSTSSISSILSCSCYNNRKAGFRHLINN